MNQEAISKIVETIKTLNINLNDATTQKLADIVLPMVQWYMILDFVKSILSFFAIIISIYFISKYVYLASKEKE